MNKNLRNSGIDIIGDAPWGTHFCQFYQTKEDLMDILVPYFKAGLENNEFCIWVTSQPLGVEEAKEALGKAVPDIDIYMKKGQIEIIPYTYWCIKEGIFDSERVLNGWVEKLNQALVNGYDGLRVTGNTFWLEKEDWNNFVDYEKKVDKIIGNDQIMAICTYSLNRCNINEIIDVIINHQFALLKREGKWKQIESSQFKRTQEVLRSSNIYNRSLIEASLDPLVTIGPDGKITDVNTATEQVTGYSRDELIGTDFTNYFTEPGKAKKGYQEVFREGLVFDYELEIRNKNGHKTPVLYNASVYKDENGEVIGVFAAARDIAKRKQAEEALQEAYENLQVQSEELQTQSEELQVQNEELQAQSEELYEAYDLLRETEERFRTLTENSPDMIARFDRQNRHTYANPAVAETYGCSQEEIIGKTHTELGRDPEQVKFLEKYYENVFTTGKPETMEFHYKSPQGEDCYFNTRIVPEFVEGKVNSVLAISRDITDIKEVEEALRLSNIYNRSLIEASLDPLVTIGPDGKITDINEATEQVTGYPRNELIGTDFSDYFTEPEKARTGYQQVFTHSEVRDYPLEIQHKDGNITPVLYNASVYKNESGKVIGVFAAARDITESKKAEEALRLSNIYNRSLIEASLDPLVTIGHDGKITDVNKATEQVTGYSRGELIGTDFTNYFTEPEKAKKGYQEVFREGLVFDYELEIRHRNGSITPVLYNASVYKDESGKVIGVFAAARDIKERKKAQERIQILANAVESSEDAIITKSLDSIITTWNKGAEKVYGYSAEQVMGKFISILEPDNFKGETRQLAKEIKQGEKICYHETLRLKKDGTIINVSITVSPVFDSTGKLVAISTIARDITERKKAEEALQEAYENLQVQSEELQVQSEEIQAQNEELQTQSEELQMQNEELQAQSEELYEAYDLLRETEERFRTLTENSPDMIARFDRQNRHTYANPAVAETYGCSQEEIIGKTHTELGRDPEQVKFLEKYYENVFTTGKPETMEFHYKSPQGKDCYFNTRIVPEFVEGKVNSVLAISRDITDIKEVEEALRLSNIYNRSLIEASLDPLVTIGPDGKITDINEATEQVTGYPRNELIGTDFSDYFTEPEKARTGYQQVFTHSEVRDYPLEIQNKDGYTTPVLYNASVYKNENGEVIGVFAAARDITEIKKTEEVLRLSNIYNRSLIEASLDPLVTIGHDGKITDVNTATQLVTGYSRDELIGTDFTNYFTEPEKAKKGYQEVFREGLVFDYELEIRNKYGYVTPVLYNASVYKDENDEVIGVFAAARDITERQKAEKELKLASRYNRSLIEASLDPLVTIGPDGKITDVNNSTEAVTGHSRDELIGTDFLDYFTEPGKAKESYQRVFQEGLVRDYPLEIKHEDGRTIPVLYNASVYKNEVGEVIGVFAAARDITERKMAEEMLKLKLEELARSNAELEQFAYVSSHDLQEPLRMISSYLQLLQRRYQGNLDDKADKYIYYAVDGAARMQVLINDLLEFSRVTTKAREPEPTDSESVLNQVLSNLELFIKENKATMSHGSLPEIIADNTQLAQVFQNLIINGIKFHSEEAPIIHISAEKKESEWIFSVQDNGIGIDSQYSEKIFEVFKRLHKKEEYPGTGIGLAICKKIIERHSGRVWVESKVGKGSTFYFTLPINPKETSKANF